MQQRVISVNYAEQISPILSHFHEGHQLIYVEKGTARITVSGNPYEAKAGTLVLISQLETHSICIESPDYTRYTVQISPDIQSYSALLGEKLLSLLVNRPAQFRHAVDMSGCPQVGVLLRQMEQESRSGAAMEQKMQLFLLCQLLVLCCRAHPEQLPENTRNLKLMRQVQRCMEQSVRTDWTLEALATQFHLSKSYLSHQFKQITGSSVISYLTNYRLMLAKQYLVETDMEIGRIVENCGFSDNSNFSRLFRRSTGLSPTQYRLRHTEKTVRIGGEL